MKVIEALKKVKANEQKIADLQVKISQHCAHLNHETPVYGDETKNKVRGWLQSCEDLTQDNVNLLCQIQHTNLNTMVPINFGSKTAVKSVAQWVWRRRKYAAIDQSTWGKLGDRNLKEGKMAASVGDPVEVRIVRNFDPSIRDENLSLYREEPSLIDSTLETVNATTELLELPG